MDQDQADSDAEGDLGDDLGRALESHLWEYAGPVQGTDNEYEVGYRRGLRKAGELARAWLRDRLGSGRKD
jgi:hypothetical protein